MPYNKYITLKASNDGTGKRYRVVEGGYKPILSKKQSLGYTIGGKLDLSQGGVYRRWEYIIRVREEEVDSNYGVLSDLKTLFQLNNPGGTPSDVITMIDFDGNTYYVSFLQDLSEQPLSVTIEGQNAWYFVPVIMHKR